MTRFREPSCHEAIELLEELDFPEFIEAGDGELVPLVQLAAALVAEADGAATSELVLGTALEAVNSRRLARLANEAGGPLELTPAVVARCCALEEAELLPLLNLLLEDWGYEPQSCSERAAHHAGAMLIVASLLWRSQHGPLDLRIAPEPRRVDHSLN